MKNKRDIIVATKCTKRNDLLADPCVNHLTMNK